MNITKFKTRQKDDKTVELVKESEKQCEYLSLNQPENIAKFMRDNYELHKETEEYVYLLCFTTDMELIGTFEVSHGTVDASNTNPRGIFQRALLCNASVMILVHNHPSGSIKPSSSDLQATKKIKELSDMMELKLLDHIIIGGELYSSLREMSGIW